MAEVNRAFAAGDEAKLRQLLNDWIASPDFVQGEGVGADLVRAIRKIHQIERRLAAIATDLETLKRSEIHGLKVLVDDASANGRDLFDEMVRDVQREIASVRLTLVSV
jgi:hypothetical protein